MSQNIRALSGFDYHVRNHPANTAVSDDRGEYCYSEIANLVDRVLNGFSALGLSNEDRVAVIAKNRVEMLVLILASLRGGPVTVPVNRRVSADEMAWIIQDAQCSVILADAGVVDLLGDRLQEGEPGLTFFALDHEHRQWPSFQGWLEKQASTSWAQAGNLDRTYLQIYTSGTSGKPKGVLLSERNCLSQQIAILATLDVELRMEERMYQALPLFHVGGVFASLWAISRGTCLVFMEEFSPPIVDNLMQSGALHHCAMVPAMIRACVNVSNDEGDIAYSELRTVLYGASPIDQATLGAAMNKFGCDFAQIYGMSETHSVITALTCSDHRKIVDGSRKDLVGAAGRAVVGLHLSVTDENGQSLPQGEVGEVRVAADHVMTGYWNAPEATNEAIREGLLYTGDAGYIDPTGYLFIVDRLKDIIVSGGENISSLEVESVLMQHAAVADAAVIGVPDARWGEAVKALVVPAGDDFSPHALETFCRQHLGDFKVPKSIEAVAAIPRNPAGKILKAQLRQPYWQAQERRVS